ncbi:MAG: CHAP domain-containing protein [Alphaproteobacteria bacterium]
MNDSSSIDRARLSLRGALAGLLAGAAIFAMTGCGFIPVDPIRDTAHVPTRPETRIPSATPTEPVELASLPQIRKGEKRLECVTYARQVTGMDIRGDAWRWWDNSKGRYQRGATPEAGGVLVFRRINGSPGHVAVVSEVVSDRVVIASHANWLNDGRIHENTPIQDVSEKGDWSAVRVWYTPGQQWGRSTYRTYGFVYSRQPLTASVPPAGT